MSAERTRTEIRFTRDPRLLPGIRAAVEFVAAHDGLSEAEAHDFGEAWQVAACDCAALLSEEHPFCTVLIEDFDDRLEVHLEHPSQVSDVRQAEGKAPDARQRLDVMRRVDRVLYNARNGTSSVTLVKFFSKKPAAI